MNYRGKYPAEHFLLPGRQDHLEDKWLWRTRLIGRLLIESLGRPPADYAELSSEAVKDSHWLWTGARQSDGRAVVRISGAVRSARRVVWTLIRRGTDTRRVVHRTCDEPRCVNPWHAEMVKQGSWQQRRDP